MKLRYEVCIEKLRISFAAQAANWIESRKLAVKLSKSMTWSLETAIILSDKLPLTFLHSPWMSSFQQQPKKSLSVCCRCTLFQVFDIFSHLIHSQGWNLGVNCWKFCKILLQDEKWPHKKSGNFSFDRSLLIFRRKVGWRLFSASYALWPWKFSLPKPDNLGWL